MNLESEPSEISASTFETMKPFIILYKGVGFIFGAYNIGRYLRDRRDTDPLVCAIGIVQVTSAIAGPYMLRLLWGRIQYTKFGIGLYDFFILRTLKGIEPDVDIEP